MLRAGVERERIAAGVRYAREVSGNCYDHWIQFTVMEAGRYATILCQLRHDWRDIGTLLRCTDDASVDRSGNCLDKAATHFSQIV